MADKADKTAEPAAAVAKLEDVKKEVSNTNEAGARAPAETAAGGTTETPATEVAGETQEEAAAAGAPEVAE